jgi:hypothetical protein
MKQKTFILRDKTVLESLIIFLRSQAETPLIEVVVKAHQKDRSLLQNSLYWRWVTVIANELGWTKEEVHHDLRNRILVPIYERDDEGFAEAINAIRKLYTQGFKRDAILIHSKIVRLTSTTSATVKQFAEYLTEIERDMIGKGIYLPHKEDQYYDALMIKQPKENYG